MFLYGFYEGSLGGFGFWGLGLLQRFLCGFYEGSLGALGLGFRVVQGFCMGSTTRALSVSSRGGFETSSVRAFFRSIRILHG